jgi:O-antigen/teichoic acid export membrane protein
LANSLNKLSTFRRGFLSTLVLDVTGRGLTALATIGFIRALDVGSFAYLVLFLNIGQFAGIALTGGIRMLYMRTEAERVSRGDQTPTGFGLAAAISMLLVLSVATLGICGVAVVDTGGSAGSRFLFVGLTAAYTAGNSAVELAMFHNQAHLKFVRGGLIGVGKGAAIIVVAIASLTGFIDSGPATAAAVAGALLFLAIVICAPLLRKALSGSAKASFGGDFTSEAAWLSLFYLASAGFAYADIFIVAGFLNDEAVSSYGAALRYMAIIIGPLPALISVLRVRTSQGDVVDSPARQGEMLMAWMKKSLIPGTAIIGLAAVAAPFVIPLLDGGRYPDSIPIFEVMLVATYVDYLTLPAPSLMMARKRYRLLACFYVIALAVQLVLAGGIATVSGPVAVAAVASVVGGIEAGGIALLALRLARRDAGLSGGLESEPVGSSP